MVAQQTMETVKQQALDAIEQHRQLEIARLEQLNVHNPHIGQEDIDRQQ